MNKSKLFLIGFGVTGIGELVSTITHSSSHYLFKPLIILMLIGYYLSSVEIRNATLLRALFFCWVGDFILMFVDNGELYFILGLMAFLIGHVFYIFTFKEMVEKQQSTLLPTQKVRYSFPIFLAGTGLIVVLYPELGVMRFPVILYATILMLMVSFALFRMGRTNSSSFIWVFIGAILFMISDCLLAINKFYSGFAYAHFYIMVTYILAQFFIVKGLLSHPIKIS
jgi:uncharacterized membrane protein YhhN